MSAPRYTPYTAAQFMQSAYWERIPGDLQRNFRVVSSVLPFRTNTFVLDELIDWSAIPDDPMYQLTFPQPGMLDRKDYETVDRALNTGTRQEHDAVVDDVRRRLNPHPAGQRDANQACGPDGSPLDGVQHKYREIVLFFPSAGQTCHAYCSFCFRWPQFVNLDGYKFQAREAETLASYLRDSPQVTDVLFTGGDPMVMKARSLERYVTPMLAIDTVETIRIGTKSLSYWPYRYLSDDDSDDILRLFERIVSGGRHLAVMAHFNHPREIDHPAVEQAIARIRAAGAVIRLQAPLLRHVNDDAEAWRNLWAKAVRLGCVPYYMFVERDTGPKDYFAVPLPEAHDIYQNAFRRISGLGRTVRGPVMSTFWGKILVEGPCEIGGETALALTFLQARDPNHVGRPFLAEWNREATWISDLVPFGGGRFFFDRETGLGPTPVATPAAEPVPGE